MALLATTTAFASDNAPLAGAPLVAMTGATENKALRSDMMLLVVDKGRLQANLETWPADPTLAKTLRAFKIAIGKGDGDKEYEGDNKTPEGVYFAQSHRTGAGLPNKYGPLAIPIDFPNPMDQIVGKTGHGIWLHGVEYDARIEEAKVTEGCVAFYNADIEKLSNWMRSHQGVVVIASDTGKVNQPTDVERVKSRTVDWMNAWADRRVDDYMAHYAPDFRYANMNRAAYKDYKGRVFSSYKEMSVTYDNLRVVTHPKYAVAFFNQDFQGDKRFSSIGRKVLYWEKAADGEWYVKREVFENRRFEFVTFSEAELALLSETGSAIPSEKGAKSPNL